MKPKNINWSDVVRLSSTDNLFTLAKNEFMLKHNSKVNIVDYIDAIDYDLFIAYIESTFNVSIENATEQVTIDSDGNQSIISTIELTPNILFTGVFSTTDELEEDGITKKYQINSIQLCFYDKKDEQRIYDLISKAIEYKYIDTDNVTQYYTIGMENNSYKLLSANISNLIVNEINIKTHYNENFISFDKDVTDKLINLHKGILFLHGEPGTGKTTYIKYLISKLCIHKDIVFIPSYLMKHISSPEFMTFLMTLKNVIIILEDAENVFMDRVNNPSVSNILNLTDGIINDTLGIQIIATFNNHQDLFDSALLRPGRLIGMYKFEKLSIDKTNKLLKKLKKPSVDKELSISEIYHGEINSNMTIKKNTIGFEV